MSIIKPCPWCLSREIGWFIKAHSYSAYAYCEECGVQGPHFTASTRLDDAKVNSEAIASWNGGRQ